MIQTGVRMMKTLTRVNHRRNEPSEVVHEDWIEMMAQVEWRINLRDRRIFPFEMEVEAISMGYHVRE